MKTTNMCYLYLTCEDIDEAKRIAEELLKEHLIVCAKFVPVECKYWWQGKIADGKEVLVMMESRQDLFSEVERIIKPLHSYDTFVLESIPVTAVSKKATTWMNQNLKEIK